MSAARPVVVCALAALLSGGCASARRGEPLAGPVALDARAERGRKVFMARCHACHPGGEGGLAPALNNKFHPAFLIRLQVRRGLGAMPSFDETKIDDAQLSDVIAYIKTLRKHRAPR